MRNDHSTADEQLLLAPHESRPFNRTDTWRVLRIMSEFVAGFDDLATLGPAVTNPTNCSWISSHSSKIFIESG
jgi:hypothetical protein